MWLARWHIATTSVCFNFSGGWPLCQPTGSIQMNEGVVFFDVGLQTIYWVFDGYLFLL